MISSSASVDDVLPEVISVIRECVPGYPTLEATTDLLAPGLVDSFVVVELIAALADRFGVELPAERLSPESFETPRAVAAAVVLARGGAKA